MRNLAVALASIMARLSRIALWTAAIGLVLMTVFVAWQVIGRKIFNDSPSWTEPGSLLLMSWFILLGGAVGIRENDHMGFEVGLHLANAPVRFLMKLTTHVLIIVFGIYMAIYGGQLAAATWDAKMPGIAIPQGMDYLPLAFGGVLFALFSLEKLVHLLAFGRDATDDMPAGPATSSVE